MNKNDRQRLIKTRLIIDKEVSVKALAGTFSVTERTIRNDLQALADKHLCEMFYGGARLIKHDEDIYFESTSINNISTLLEAPSTTKARSYPAVSRANETSPEIYILGSFNIDIVLEVNEFPKVGESVLAHSTKYYGGGKGANQAIAAAKINDQVHLTIKVGQDLFADRAKNYLANANIASLNILEDAEHPTGNAIILVSQPSGENKIAINLGANSHITVDDIIHDLDYIRDCRVFLTQLENNFDIMSLAKTGREREHIVKLMPVQLTQHPVPFPDMGCSCPQIAASSASLPYGWFPLAACSAPCAVHRPISEGHHLDISGRHPHSSRHPEPSAGYFQLPSALVPLRQTALVSVQPS